jgi:hypothetical protein
MSQILTAQDACNLYVLPTNPLYDAIVKDIKQAALIHSSISFMVPAKWSESVEDAVDCLKRGGFIVETVERTSYNRTDFPYVLNIIWRCP